jgi:hypothetical protein
LCGRELERKCCACLGDRWLGFEGLRGAASLAGPAKAKRELPQHELFEREATLCRVTSPRVPFDHRGSRHVYRRERFANRADPDFGAKLFGDQIRNFVGDPVDGSADSPP